MISFDDSSGLKSCSERIEWKLKLGHSDLPPSLLYTLFRQFEHKTLTKQIRIAHNECFPAGRRSKIFYTAKVQSPDVPLSSRHEAMAAVIYNVEDSEGEWFRSLGLTSPQESDHFKRTLTLWVELADVCEYVGALHAWKKNILFDARLLLLLKNATVRYFVHLASNKQKESSFYVWNVFLNFIFFEVRDGFNTACRDNLKPTAKLLALQEWFKQSMVSFEA
ncbi:Capsid assembly scaffolding protein [Trichinella pseudospiralis]